jgi:hypothetical protein
LGVAHSVVNTCPARGRHVQCSGLTVIITLAPE